MGWLVALAMCIGPASAQPGGLSGPEVLTLRLKMSNVHLIKGPKPILVDAGGPDDMPELVKSLAAHGLRVEDIALVVLTHGHSDHAGLAAEIQRLGHAKIALGAGDVPMAKQGDHGALSPTNFTGRILARFAIDPRFPPFEPDIVVTAEFDLAPWGVAGRAVAMPGHTPGSVVLLLDDARAFVGDVILGGYLGGALRPQKAGPHYFHAALAQNESNIQTLLHKGIKTFYLGHGGPVSRESVIEAFPARDAVSR
jgi:glyoxylase-like metal-dependent hydrolase (beta-lactamase superfamily II)